MSAFAFDVIRAGVVFPADSLAGDWQTRDPRRTPTEAERPVSELDRERRLEFARDAQAEEER